jgi:hypothetical protein
MRILVLSGYLPSAQARQARQETSYYLCEFLAREHEVHLLSFFTKDDEATPFRSKDLKIYQYSDQDKGETTRGDKPRFD